MGLGGWGREIVYSKVLGLRLGLGLRLRLVLSGFLVLVLVLVFLSEGTWRKMRATSSHNTQVAVYKLSWAPTLVIEHAFQLHLSYCFGFRIKAVDEGVFSSAPVRRVAERGVDDVFEGFYYQGGRGLGYLC